MKIDRQKLLLEIYKMALSETIKYYYVKAAREEKVYGANYIKPNAVDLDVCIAEDAMRIARTSMDYWNKYENY